MYNLLTAKVKGYIRKIDVITMNELKSPVSLYTFEIADEVPEIGEDHIIGDIILKEEFTSANIEAYKAKSEDYMFTIDADIAQSYQIIDQIQETYKEALADYISVSWENASNSLESCLNMIPSDGPSILLLDCIMMNHFAAPEDCRCYRYIDEPFQIMDQDEMDEEEMAEEKKEETPEEKKENKNEVKPTEAKNEQ